MNDDPALLALLKTHQQQLLHPNQSSAKSSNASGEPEVYLLDPVALQTRMVAIEKQTGKYGTQPDRFPELKLLLRPKVLRLARPEHLEALQAFRAENPHLDELLQTIELRIWTQIISKAPLHLGGLLLSGPPGLGKSWLGRQLAAALGLSYLEFQLGGSGDVMTLAGSAQQWGQSAPSALLRRMAECPEANPVICFDEVDKCAPFGLHGLVTDILLMLLEPENASRYEDKFISLPARMDYASYLLTANDVQCLSEPLLSRVRCVQFAGPARECWPQLVRKLYRSQIDALGLGKWFSAELDDALCEAISARCSTIRELKQRLEESIQLALQPMMQQQQWDPPATPLQPVLPPWEPPRENRIGFY